MVTLTVRPLRSASLLGKDTAPLSAEEGFTPITLCFVSFDYFLYLLFSQIVLFKLQKKALYRRFWPSFLPMGGSGERNSTWNGDDDEFAAAATGQANMSLRTLEKSVEWLSSSAKSNIGLQ